MKLKDAKSIILFRFHEEPENARESIKILQHFNPGMEIHAMFGGPGDKYPEAHNAISELVKSTWLFPADKPVDWKWQHSDLMTKRWFRDVGSKLDFDFLFSYEYDLLTLKPLLEIYPNVDDDTLALAACEPLTEERENTWSWLVNEPYRSNFLKFCEYMDKTYGQPKQSTVCLGPGQLFPRKFLDEFSQTEDVDIVHEELTIPAFAEALGFKMVNHGMHPGFGKTNEETKFFNCHRERPVTLAMIKEQLADPDGVRAFHPVKEKITLNQLENH